MNPPLSVEITNELDEAEVDAVAYLIERVTEADGVRPLSEATILELMRQPQAGLTHLCAWSAGQLLGYAALDTSTTPGSPTVELAVDARARHTGIGGQLLDLATRHTRGQLSLWAHGEFSPAGRLAADRGFSRERTLFRMRRTLRGPLPKAPIPDGVTFETFHRSQLPDLVALNRRAFVELPDQGELTEQDFSDRMAEDWFDPTGLIVAIERDSGNLVGFHWTKVEPLGDGELPDVTTVGEVYVLAVDPTFNGRGLGRALTVAGLTHLADEGLSEVMLFVDASNAAAIGLYSRLAFVTYDTDILFRSPVPPAPGA